MNNNLNQLNRDASLKKLNTNHTSAWSEPMSLGNETHLVPLDADQL